LFQKHGTFNFGYQFWFLGPTIIIFTKLNWKNYTMFACSFKLYTLSLISSLRSQRLLHVSCNNCQTYYLPFMIPFNWCNIVSTHKSIKNWTFDFAWLVGVQSLCKLLLSWGKNLQPCLQSTLYNMYVNLNKPMISCHVVSQISISWIMIKFHYFMSLFTCNLLRISMPWPHVLQTSKDRPQNSYFNNVFSWRKCWQ
jgi:hypothetical protein